MEKNGGGKNGVILKVLEKFGENVMVVCSRMVVVDREKYE